MLVYQRVFHNHMQDANSDYAPHPELVTNLGQIPGRAVKSQAGSMACLMKPEAQKKHNIPYIN